MVKKASFSVSYFWLLVVLALLLAGLALAAVSWNYGYAWLQTVRHVCESGLRNLAQHLPLTWQLVLLGLVSVALGRGIWSLYRQVQQTRRFRRLFSPLTRKPPARLRPLLRACQVQLEQVVYLDLATPHAFCLGFWRARIWLTAGLVNGLTDEELTAVIAHEAYHCRRRDPLRLVISRTLQAAFFFLPLAADLAKLAELQQEVAADRAAVAHIGDDLPLLCAVQKLLTGGIKSSSLPSAPLIQFNVTEARLRRLVYPSAACPFDWCKALARCTLNLSVVFFLGSVSFLSFQPVMEHEDIGACLISSTGSNSPVNGAGIIER